MVYTSEPSELDDTTPTYLIYPRDNAETFDIEFNFPIGSDLEHELPEECQIGGLISEENVLCTNCSLNRTIELAEKLLDKVFLPAPSYDLRVVPEEPESQGSSEKVTANKIERELEQDTFLNKEERRNFYKECLHRVKEAEIRLVADFRFKDLNLNGDEAWIQFLSQPGKVTFMGTLGHQLSKESDVKKLSSKCNIEKQDPGGVDPNFKYLTNCEGLELEEAVNIAEMFFEDLCNIPEEARPILEIYH